MCTEVWILADVDGDDGVWIHSIWPTKEAAEAAKVAQAEEDYESSGGAYSMEVALGAYCVERYILGELPDARWERRESEWKETHND